MKRLLIVAGSGIVLGLVQILLMLVRSGMVIVVPALRLLFAFAIMIAIAEIRAVTAE